MPASREFPTITTQGGLVPAELLGRLAQQPDSVSGTAPDNYHLLGGMRLRDAINRSWTDLQGAWAVFRTELASLPQDGRATTITRERWLLPLFAELGYGRLNREPERVLEGKTYPISHGWGPVPIHLLGADVDLDHRSKGVAGAAAAAPHSMVQEYLNRASGSLWGLLSNGRRLRILRDNASLTRAAYVEFDLEAMFEGMVFTDFALLWLTCHQSRFEPLEGNLPSSCWLERWLLESQAQGVRALDTLRTGFKAAIGALGSGFLGHPANGTLRQRLRDGQLSSEDYYRQVLRVIYRFVFLLVAEDRDLLHVPDASPEARRRYGDYYSLGTIRDFARHHRGGRHGDLWESRKPVFAALDHTGLAALGLPALGSFLWSANACPDLDGAQLANRDLLSAIRHLAYTQRDHLLHRVDFVNLGPEELGSIYESLLELHPRLEADAGRFELIEAEGNERKTSGSYYTPTSLIAKLLETALDPVLNEAARSADSEQAILDLKVIDPACGSGHFLIAAGHRIATRLASVRSGELTPPPSTIRHALRDVVGRCLYGIDVNPMALELAKVNLWLEAVEPGRPLSFLDHHLVRGNALLGATPKLLEEGIPDDAFVALTGDDKAVAKSLKKQNHEERGGRQGLFGVELRLGSTAIAAQAAAVAASPDDTLEGYDAKEESWNQLLASDPYRDAVFAANLWCAAYVAPKTKGSPAITQALFEAASSRPERVDALVRDLVTELAGQYGFLHWHLAFPDAYDENGSGGFDVVVGNPPWEKVKLSEKEFFAGRAPEIAAVAGSNRKELIAKLEAEDPGLWDDYLAALRVAEGESHFLRKSGAYPLCGRGDVNTYAVFAETMRDGLTARGRMGVIVPTGIATDDTTKYFFADCVDNQRLVSLYDFENAAPLFPAVHRSYKFCLLTLGGADARVAQADFAFFAHQVSDLDDPERRFPLTPDDFALINPNTRTAPVFKTRRDAAITKKIYQRVPVLVREGDPEGNPWGIEFSTMFHMTNDSHLFRKGEDLAREGAVLEGNIWVRGKERWLPLYEAKMAAPYDHRAADVVISSTAILRQGQPAEISENDHANPTRFAMPRYWVRASEVEQARGPWTQPWLLAFRRITSSTNERTFLAHALPVSAIGDSIFLANTTNPIRACLLAALNTYALDFCARQKLGGVNMLFFIASQLPIPAPAAFDDVAPWAPQEAAATWLAPRVLELTYTAWDLEGFARDLGYEGPPFRWDTERRQLLRAEIDAAFFHLYGVEQVGVDYIMDTFSIVRRKDEADFGEYRTKRLILERYDEMTEAITSGGAYEAALNPPPGDPRCAHPAK
ncbi:MAG: N-6 DNA methylase [Actinomycetota bacterium]|nr:N-6 DNA methylase [Actinomycetota bacterium]